MKRTIREIITRKEVKIWQEPSISCLQTEANHNRQSPLHTGFKSNNQQVKRIFLLLLLLVIFRSSYGSVFGDDVDQQVKEQVASKFTFIDNVPLKYYSNILIQLKGFPTKQDSLIVQELVHTLNTLIDTWHVYLVANGTANIILDINTPFEKNQDGLVMQHRNSYEIIKSTIPLNLPPDMAFAARKKKIFYYLIRSLAVPINNYVKIKPVQGSVFTELGPDKITLHPIDYQIIKALYSKKYDEKIIKKYSGKNTPKRGFEFTLSLFVNWMAILLSVFYLTFISRTEVFKKNTHKLLNFLKQGMLVFISFIIYSAFLMISPDSSMFQGRTFASYFWIGLFFSLLGFISIIVIFLIERTILERTENYMLEIILPLLTTILVPTLLLLFIEQISNKSNNAVTSSQFIFSLIPITSLIGIARAFYIYMNKQAESIIRKKDIELAQMSELQKQAELQSLRAKINPHFLYNALNSIASLATTDAKKTEQMSLALSDFFKYAINREQKQLNSLSEELNATRTYLEIEKVRFGDRLSFDIDCPPELLEIQIPQLLIQPLVENAIKHGLSQITEKGLIRIVVSRNEDQLKIRVYDNGPSFPDEPLTGFGIRNTHERIALLYGEQASVNWNNGEEKYIELILPVVNQDLNTKNKFEWLTLY